MVEHEPELYRNESKFGPIPDIPVGTTWRNRQVTSDTLSRNSLTTGLREECSKARIHTSTKAGISGGRSGAYSIVMSGGYSDDVDKGDVMYTSGRCFLDHFISPAVHRVYTGTGGRDDENSRYGGGNNRSWGGGEQTKDQTFEHKDNNSLVVSSHNLAGGTDLTIVQVSFNLSKPVRVIRGHQLNSRYAPWEGFVTDNSPPMDRVN